ncbi:MAG TPA: hypothetical protein VEF76_08835 [Patescibacteria group bacterium]|nr:hypothetical protein [Patescibacteria group bacterium]
MTSHRVAFRRLNDIDTGYFEIKDPSVVKAPDGSYFMFATLGTEKDKPWCVGRFKADHPGGPWQELEPTVITNIAGPEVVAPAVVLNAKGEWEMFIQTSCFSTTGVIAQAVSLDGRNFHGAALPAMTKDDVPQGPVPVVSLYDVALSDIRLNGRDYDCMTFSGYRSLGCGDVYVSLREKGTECWEAPQLALKQEDVPFHNKPGTPNYEWGLEGAKVVQLADDLFLMVGVAFLDKELTERGTRQRVFFAASRTPNGPFEPMETPIDPTAYPEGTGENGHPDTIDLGDKIGLLYQERAGEGKDKPWHLRYTEFDKDDLIARMQAKLAPPAPIAPYIPPQPPRPHCP